jgi:hypothetical protein
MTFIKIPFQLYKNEKYYVPPLISERKKFFDKKHNPFFQHARAAYYLAYKDGRPVGRIAGIVNDLHNSFHEEKTGFFGFLDCIDDLDVANNLMAAAEKFVKNEGMNIIRGPMNFSTNDEVGFLIDGFDKYPTFMMTYNPPYYQDLCEKMGLQKAEDLLAFYIDANNMPSERILNIVEKLRTRQRIKIRTMNMDDFDHELEIIRTIYNAAWSKNWGFVPMTPEEFQVTADDFKKILEPKLALLAFVDDEPAGFSLALPDYNPIFKKMNGRMLPFGALKFLYYTKINKIISGVRLITMGIVHKYHKIGLDMIFFVDTYRSGRECGYAWGELSWILERNILMTKAATDMGAKIYKRYRIYEKPI